MLSVKDKEEDQTAKVTLDSRHSKKLTHFNCKFMWDFLGSLICRIFNFSLSFFAHFKTIKKWFHALLILNIMY